MLDGLYSGDGYEGGTRGFVRLRTVSAERRIAKAVEISG